MSKVIVIGGGPAGMMAAYAAAESGHAVTLLEQNEKLGKKLFITGKGRCNLTNASDMEQLFANVVSNRKFLYSAFYSYDNEQVISFFESHGMPTKTERGNRVFPVSDHSSDVIAALSAALREQHVEVFLHTKVKRLLLEKRDEEKRVTGVELADHTKMHADAVIVATGGISYPSTGATGDGYRMAEESGHKMVSPTPALVPMEMKEPWVRDLQGLSLRNVRMSVTRGKKKLYEDFGEMLFTHFGVSGPLVLSASGCIPAKAFDQELSMTIDLKPALDVEQLDHRILREFDEMKNKQFKNSLGHLLPAKMIPVMIALSGIDPDTKVNEISREQRQNLLHLFKNMPLTITGLRDFKEAIITKGGVSVKDINPSTMESKLVQGLYFCGEVLDLDALTGGYNLQIAWSTGHLAGISVL
ncbi:MAG: NAD(P)/FAD-dependent oxidoreductase [Roseburia faecis]|jgi:predicted Rossmann fold flavoprotein|uniref:Aminoacetone oxidase family FAD-binding enzyme n=1 Tax=Roseburia faecis TaxID=301302 RepID=A0A844KII0_9FIRM|nr:MULTISPECIES: NAD(P)/FAD-dependent oxidoreductase [Roseburia]OLA63067.1 MAG: FAD-dependent oxidoreductase [Roseburia sp. CAG:18_43_25]HBA07678.1 aminoacetone oxidase family FAD-binding enzyme [Roseburia sp.]MED9950663.1 NAD(P)/FAD-dependent oxidoreductase [Roseburia faecis]MTR80246.1 aminoacetone oxidase family FAD-binding enzyme [Roseburia faecis]MTR89539.1 aminoacetone oxidase family FAD-binding enzyme [Roseburia faecis]